MEEFKSQAKKKLEKEYTASVSLSRAFSKRFRFSADITERTEERKQ